MTANRKGSGPNDDRDLVYRVVEEAVFAPRYLARAIDQIHKAIDESGTWGKFKKAMPAADYEELMKWQFDDQDEPRPDPEDEFDTDSVEGGGDYPPWLQPRMGEWIPHDLLDRYGKWVTTSLDGNYWAIPGVLATRLAAELRARGYKVAKADKLEFY